MLGFSQNMENEGIIIYRFNGIRIAYDPHQSYCFMTTKQKGKTEITKLYHVDFKTYLEDLHIGLKGPSPKMIPVLEFLQETGNEPTKELASQLLEQLF